MVKSDERWIDVASTPLATRPEGWLKDLRQLRLEAIAYNAKSRRKKTDGDDGVTMPKRRATPKPKVSKIDQMLSMLSPEQRTAYLGLGKKVKET